MDTGPAPNRDSRVRNFNGESWTLASIATILVIARMYVRSERRSIGADDWMMLGALVMAIAQTIVVDVSFSYGNFEHATYVVGEGKVTSNILLNYSSEILGLVSVLFSKTSVGLFLKRIFGKTGAKRRWFLMINVCLYWGISIPLAVIIWVHCQPVRAGWDIALAATATCISNETQKSLAITSSVFGAYLDFCFALLPITIVYNLKVPTARKRLLMVLLGLGVFGGAAAIVRTTYLPILFTNPDTTYNVYWTTIWASLELYLVIICGSVPSCAPLWDAVFHGKPITDQPSIMGSVGKWIALRFNRSQGSEASPTVSDRSSSEQQDMHNIKRTVEVQQSSQASESVRTESASWEYNPGATTTSAK